MQPRMSEPHVVIVGGGFSGTAVAIHLLREAARPLHISIIEPRNALGQGVAYSASDPAHRINVPAARMQLAGDDDGAFDRWYRRHGDFPQDPQAQLADGSIYPQRGAFSRYLQAALASEISAQRGRVRHLQDRAVDWHNGQVVTEKGERLQPDSLVLAISHPPPQLPGGVGEQAHHPRVIANPWQPGTLETIPSAAKVAIMGTALSMGDVVASLHRQGHQGDIIAFSRHGLLSRPNAPMNLPKWTIDVLTGTLRQRLKHVRQEIRRAAEAGLPWQVVLDAVRSQGQVIWQQMSNKEKRQFQRHLRRFWDVHRYRIAPQVSQAIESRQRAGTLRVQAARLKNTRLHGDTLRLELLARGGEPQTEMVDYLVLTTGPAHSNLISGQPFLSALQQAGVIRADALGMGIDVNAQSQPVGSTLPIWVAGPAARGRFGELMGLPQVADHAQQVAHAVLEKLGCRQRVLS